MAKGKRVVLVSVRDEENKGTGESDDKKTEQTPSWVIWSAASYAIVMLLIGLPLWWKTTAVQRVFLPYEQMLGSKEYLDGNFKIKLDIGFYGVSPPGDEIKLPDSFPGCSLNYTFASIIPDDLELIYKTSDIYDVDSGFCDRYSGSESIRVYYVGRADLLKQYGKRVVLGNCRTAYYISNSNKLDISMVNSLLEKLLPSSRSLQIDMSASSEKLQLPLSLGYEILFSLLIPQPELQNFQWDVKGAQFQEYMNLILGKLSEFADIRVRSQYLYYVNLNVNPSYDKSRKIYQVSHDQLPLVINPVEYKLSSFVSQNTALNFLIYTAPCDEVPLHILDADRTLIPNNAFLVPQWGGIQIYNGACKPQNGTSEPEQVSLKQIMSVVGGQFRDLVGVPSYKTKDVLDIRRSVFRDWEVDMISRKRLANLLYTSANTLQSLGQLLDQITNIVVTEEVGLEVEKSVKALASSVEASLEGNLIQALREAKTAFRSSEIAFHHPTNLAQLYFPDDQKYAIYIPLFLPIGIPVLWSLQTIFSQFTARFKKAKTE